MFCNRGNILDLFRDEMYIHMYMVARESTCRVVPRVRETFEEDFDIFVASSITNRVSPWALIRKRNVIYDSESLSEVGSVLETVL